MKNTIAKIACFALILTGALIAAPTVSRADDSTNAPAATPKKHGLPFHGKVSAVDTAAMTFTVGSNNMTIAVSSTTKIVKDGQPAVFSDITVGQMVSGSYKKDDEGKMNATRVTIGMMKKKTTETGTNAPPAQ